MNLLQLSWKNLTNKPLAMTLSLVLFALGVGLISLLLLLSKQLQDKFDKNLAGIDLVVGAKGSPLQLILNSMYHIDAPTGNVSIDEVKAFLNPRHPLIATAVPLSMGDSYKTYRIVGTNHKILELYKAQIGEGQLWKETFEVTLGANVAEELGLKIGDEFYSSHGLVMDAGMEHADTEPFKVVGILQPTGAVIDQLILTNTQSIWAVHEHSEVGKGAEVIDEEEESADTQATTDEPASAEATADEGEHYEHEDLGDVNTPLLNFTDRDITSVLVKFKGRSYQALNMQRSINENTDLQAATPAIEINRLYSMMGVGEEALQALALVIIFVSGLSVFISLYSSLKERRYELALMRVMGSSPGKLFVLIVMEGLLLAVLGYVIGIILSHASMEILAGYMKASYRYSFTGWTFLPQEIYLLAAALGIGFLAAVIPAIQAMRTDISTTLAEG